VRQILAERWGSPYFLEYLDFAPNFSWKFSLDILLSTTSPKSYKFYESVSVFLSMSEQYSFSFDAISWKTAIIIAESFPYMQIMFYERIRQQFRKLNNIHTQLSPLKKTGFCNVQTGDVKPHTISSKEFCISVGMGKLHRSFCFFLSRDTEISAAFSNVLRSLIRSHMQLFLVEWL